MGDRRGRGPGNGGAVRRFALLFAIWVAGLSTPQEPANAKPQRPGSGSPPGTSWVQVSRLITGQRLSEAIRLLQTLHKAALAGERSEDAARAAIRLAQVRMTLSHYELAVSVLHEQLNWQLNWQQRQARGIAGGGNGSGPEPALLALFYAQTLRQYAQMYSFQVSRRERLTAPAATELSFQNTLRGWTRGQLLAEARSAMAAAWEQRAGLGALVSAELPEYVESVSAPSQERTTLRDLLSYEYADLLLLLAREPGGAGAAEDVPPVVELLREDLVAAAPPATQPAQRHPLIELAALLGDLERWHRAAGRSAAAIAAKVERLSLLHQGLPDAAQRAELRTRLAELLPTTGELPIAATVHATLADLLRQEAQAHPGAAGELLTQAHATAAQGARLFPASPGARRCRQIVQALTAAELRLASRAVMTSAQPSLQVTHRNLPTAYFRAYVYEPLTRLLAGDAEGLQPGGRELDALLRNGKPVAVWSTALPATPDLQSRVSTVPLPLREPGAYFVVGSERADFARGNNQLEVTRLELSDLVLWTTDAPAALRVTAVSGRTGEPLSGVEVSIYGATGPTTPPGTASEQPIALLHRTHSGPEGSAELPRLDTVGSQVVVGRLNGQTTLLAVASTAETDGAETLPPATLTTDRSVYHPQQKVRWRLAATHRPANAEEQEDDAALVMTLLDADFQQVERSAVTLNRFGTAAGELLLPRGRPLGRWHLAAWRGAVRYAEAVLRVEDPPLPAFTVALGEPESPLRLGEPVMLRGVARRASGAPVTNGRLRYWVTRQPLMDRAASPEQASRAPVLVARGESAMQEGGGFRVTFTDSGLKPDARDPGGADVATVYRYCVTAEVTAAAGASGTAQRSFHLSAVQLQAELHAEWEFLRAGQPAVLIGTRYDLDGRPQAGPASWHLVRLTDPPARTQPALPLAAAPPADRPEATVRSPLFERPDGAEQTRGELLHAADGRAELKLPGLPAGAYRLRYQSRDAQGRSVQTAREILVISEGAVGNAALPLPVLLLRERAAVSAGSVARFAVGSARSGQALFVEVHHPAGTTERRLLRAGQDPMLLAIPTHPTDHGTLRVTITAVSDYQLWHLEQRVTVEAPDEKPALQVEFADFRDRLRSGSRESIRVLVRTAAGAVPEPGTTELFAYMYDRRRDEEVQPTRTTDSEVGPGEPAPASGFAHSLESGAADGQPAARPQGAERPTPRPLRPERLRLRLNFTLRQPSRDALAEPGSAPGRRRVSAVEAGSAPAYPEVAAAPYSAAPVGVAPLPYQLAEPAFFLPQLRLPPDGAAVIEFTVPDASAKWCVQVEARTRDRRLRTVTRSSATDPAQ